MIHQPRDIKDRVAVGDDIFIIEELEEGRVRLIPDPTHVLEVGTPIDKALLQPIENALGAVTQKLSGIDEGANRIPAGLIAMWSGSVANIPSGWALCDGSNGTPDLRDRFIVGAGGSYNVGSRGGQKEVTLTVNQIPPHNHTYRGNTGTQPGWGPTGGSGHPRFGDMTTSQTGGGQPHENRPPYYALAYIMKL
jgi:hypothetical protein